MKSIARLAELATSQHLEIEVNPLLITEQRAWIADTLMETWI